MAPRFLILLVAAVLCPSAFASRTWYVDQQNCPGPGDGSQGNPFCKIQEGIDAAASGDTVLVMPGTYVENVDYKDKGLALMSAQGPLVTTIDGNHAGAVVRMVGPSSLEGFSIV